MKNIIFACFAPHPPLLLPSIGSEEDRERVKETIQSLESLGEKLKKKKLDSIIISSPHPDWGFNVPLHFLAPDFKKEKIEKHLLGTKSSSFYFEKGKKKSAKLKKDKKYALIASGDMSHCLKEDGPYGFHPEGPKFDEALIKNLKDKNIEKFLELENKFPNAAFCGLNSFSFLLGILEGSKIKWEPKVLSYEGPFGVGYLVVNFKLQF